MEPEGDVGVEVKVYLVQAEGECAIDVVAMFDNLRRRLPAYMVPRFVEIVDELPMTPTHKVRKNLLRERAPGPRTWDRLALAPGPTR